MKGLVKSGKAQVSFIAIVTALCLLGDSMLYVALPIHWKAIGLMSLTELGVILSINRVVRIAFNPLINWIYSKIRLQTGLVAAVIIAAATTAGYGVVKGFAGWVVLRCAWGFAWCLLRLGGLFTVTECARDNNRGYLMGVYNGLYRLGSLFGMLFGGTLVIGIGFEYTALVFALISILGVPMVLLFNLETANNKLNSDEATIWHHRIWHRRNVLKVAFSGGVIAFLYQGMIVSTLSYIIKYLFGDEVPLLGQTINVTTIAGTTLALRWVWEPFLAKFFGKWSDGHGGRLILLKRSLLLAATGFLLIQFSLPFMIWIALVLVILVTATSLTTIVDTLASDAAKRLNRKSIMAIYAMLTDCGAALAPFACYLLLSINNGITYVCVLCSVLCMCLFFTWNGSSFFYIFCRNNKRNRMRNVE